MDSVSSGSAPRPEAAPRSTRAQRGRQLRVERRRRQHADVRGPRVGATRHGDRRRRLARALPQRGVGHAARTEADVARRAMEEAGHRIPGAPLRGRRVARIRLRVARHARAGRGGRGRAAAVEAWRGTRPAARRSVRRRNARTRPRRGRRRRPAPPPSACPARTGAGRGRRAASTRRRAAIGDSAARRAGAALRMEPCEARVGPRRQPGKTARARTGCRSPARRCLRSRRARRAAT